MKIILLLIWSLLLFIATAPGQITEIYVSDAGNFNNPPWQILKFDGNGQNPEVFIDSNLAWPQDILFLDSQGVVLISNLNSNQITKYNSSSGNYLGTFATGISGPTRMKIGEDSLLYVLQWSGNGRVKRFQLDGTFVDDFTNVGVPQSIGLDWDSTGNLYVSSYSGDFVRKFNSSGIDQGLFVNSDFAGPTNIWFDDNGDLLVIDYDGTAVKRFDSAGNYLSDFITGLSNSEGIDFFLNGNILIGNGATSSVKLFDSNGTYLQDLIASGAGNLLTPNAIVIRENISVPIIEGDESVTENQTFILKQNYPNPFNPSTTIRYQIPHSTFVTVEVFDLTGREVAVLVNEQKAAGSYHVNFNAGKLASGMYFYHIQAGNFQKVRKMLLME